MVAPWCELDSTEPLVAEIVIERGLFLGGHERDCRRSKACLTIRCSINSSPRSRASMRIPMMLPVH
ncbi:hypothetical protein MHY1_p00147 (plasmid) [Methylovirgula sp. HY1]|nr:hypothetical protein MHY1_p00147 [Methylovirgula sp. HY1]